MINWDKYKWLRIEVRWLKENHPEVLEEWKLYRENMAKLLMDNNVYDEQKMRLSPYDLKGEEE